MTWFATALWTFTWFNAALNRPKINDAQIQDHQFSRRQLEDSSLYGLPGNYPTIIGETDSSIMPWIKFSILLLFPIMSFLLIQKNFARLSKKDFHTKFSTLYTDMRIKKSA